MNDVFTVILHIFSVNKTKKTSIDYSMIAVLYHVIFAENKLHDVKLNF